MVVALGGEIRPLARSGAASAVCAIGLPWALTLCVLLIAGSATGASQGITGKRLLLRNASKFVLLSKDASIHISASPMCPAADSSITLDDGVHSHTFALPCANWSDSSGMARYRNSSASSAPSVVNLAEARLLKVVGHGLGGFPTPNGPATIAVVLNLGGTIDRYCLSFSGTGNGSKFLVKNVPATTCPVCGNDIIEPAETCDGTADAACPGDCRADCTCPTPVCGNNVREGSEACDGPDASACPTGCLPDCECAASCPVTNGDASACQGFGTIPQCSTCCTDEECFVCVAAFNNDGCSQAESNYGCTLAVTEAGCAAVCCP